MEDICQNVRENWILISDPQDSSDAHYYDRVELYSGCFDSVSQHSHHDKVFAVGGSFGGPILVLENKLLTIYSAAGVKISERRWGNGPVIAAGWSETEEAVFVQENGKVLVYSMFGNFKYEVSMGEEASLQKVHSAKIFPSSRGTGVAVLTKETNDFFSVQNIADPKLKKLHDYRSPGGQDNISTPNSWCPMARDKQERLVVARDSDLVLLSVNEVIPLEVQVQDPEQKQAEVLFVATSPSQDKICAVMDNGRVWMGTERGEITAVQTNSLPSDLVWCGEEAVLLAGSFASILLHQSGGMETIWLESSLVCVVQECDGVRIIRQGGHDLIQKVNDAAERIFKIASPESGFLLLQASQYLKQKSHKADELLRMIKDNMMQLRQSVTQCIGAAGAVFCPEHQKELLRAAKFGTAFMEAGITTEKFYSTCESLKILNNVRHQTVGIPLTQPQLEALGVGVLIDRLIARRLFAFAIEVAEFKKLPPAEGRSRILAHWAMYKVEAPSKKDEAEIAAEINSRLNQDPDISYSDIAEIAMKCEPSRTQLAEMLLEHEVRADRQVPLLMKMGKGGKAIQKAIQSGDTDMIYHVILALRDHGVKASEFHMIVRNHPEASRLYSLYCRQYEPHSTSLADWLQQEDDLGGMARLSFAESYSSSRIESRMAHLVTAQGQFKRAREEFSAGMAEENHRLLNNQSRLEEQLGKPFVNLSLNETLKQLLKEGETKTADKLKADFKISDRKYYWIKIRAYGESSQWTELLTLAKSKKSPIGIGPFIDQCLKYDEKGQATKYLELLSQEEKLRYYEKLDLLQEAANIAFSLRNMEALSALEGKANQSRDHALLEIISSYKQRLMSSR